MAKPDPRHHMVKAIEAITDRMLTDSNKDHNTVRNMRGELTRVRMGAEALDRLNATRSPLDTPQAHALKVAKKAKTYHSEVTAALNRAMQTWAQGYGDAQNRMIDKINLRPDAFASEIRAAFRTLNTKEKMNLVRQLVDENRGPELAAIVKAPSVLTGLSDADRDAFEKAIFAKHAAAEMAELEMLEEAMHTFNAAANASAMLVKELTDPAQIAAIERSASEAEAAEASFNQALSGDA